MTYQRVIPRDLFNEAKLLKCLGKLVVLSERYPQLQTGFVEAGDYSHFVVVQNPDSGDLSVANVVVFMNEKPVELFTPLNARDSWPLYVQYDDSNEPELVFRDDDTGEFSDVFKELLTECLTWE